MQKRQERCYGEINGSQCAQYLGHHSLLTNMGRKRMGKCNLHNVLLSTSSTMCNHEQYYAAFVPVLYAQKYMMLSSKK